MKKFIFSVIGITLSLFCLFSFSSCIFIADYLISSSEDAVKKQLVLTEEPVLNITLNEESNLYIVEVIGTLKNESSETVENLTLYLSACDAQGNLVCSLQTDLYSVVLGSGETWKFYATGSYSASLPVVTSCKISDIYFW